jgi:cytochrome c-type biogenesis protein CcmH
MIAFWLICGLLIAVALAFVLPPLRNCGVHEADITDATLAVYRGQLTEIRSDLHDGIITEEQFERDREELERRLILEVPRSRLKTLPHPQPISSELIYIVAISVPLAAVVLYLQLGSPP